MNLLLQYIPLCLLLVLLGVLLRRRALEVCPCFLAYVVFAVAADVARFLVHNQPHTYYATYWTTEAGYCVLGILVMYEVLRGVLALRLILPAVLASAIATAVSWLMLPNE